MPPKRRRHYKPKAEKPTVFGPEPPPAPQPGPSTAPPALSPSSEAAPPASPTSQKDTGGQVEVKGTAQVGGRGRGQGGGGGRRKKLPRKKFKDDKGGWGEGEELPEHEEDKERYSSELPWDLRLLRACDEFRSARSFRDLDTRHNYRTVLHFFRVDIVQLRDKYGPQPLRGYDPEGEQLDDAESDEDDPLQDAKDAELDKKSEEEFAQLIFNPARVAKFFDNRQNDGYTRTLTLAPRIMTSFLKFHLSRNVFSAYKASIKACLAICAIAEEQLLPAQTLFKTQATTASLPSAVNRLFPEAGLTVPVPFVADHQPVDLAAGATSFSFDYDPSAIKEELYQLDPPADWASSKNSSPEADAIAHAERIKKQIELDAQTLEKWSRTSQSLPAIVEHFLRTAERLKLIEAGIAGTWMVGNRERSARTFLGWERLAGKTAKEAADARARAPLKRQEQEGEAGKAAAAEHLLVRLKLGPHEGDFPLTEQHRSMPHATYEAVPDPDFAAKLEDHSLSSPIELVLDIPPTFNLDHFVSLSSAVLEADLTQLVFVPATPPTSTSTYPQPSASSVWLISSLYRVIPPYWREIKPDLLRDEPGRPRSFDAAEDVEDKLAEQKERWAAEEAEELKRQEKERLAKAAGAEEKQDAEKKDEDKKDGQAEKGDGVA
ncbi:hypothetical protein JCM10213_000505 [Rhodosporidiobolus nylandii]